MPCYHGAYSSFCISLSPLFASSCVHRWRRCKPRQLREWKSITETGKCVDRRMELTADPKETLCFIIWFGQSERTVFTWANNWTFVSSKPKIRFIIILWVTFFIQIVSHNSCKLSHCIGAPREWSISTIGMDEISKQKTRSPHKMKELFIWIVFVFRCGSATRIHPKSADWMPFSWADNKVHIKHGPSISSNRLNYDALIRLSRSNHHHYTRIKTAHFILIERIKFKDVSACYEISACVPVRVRASSVARMPVDTSVARLYSAHSTSMVTVWPMKLVFFFLLENAHKGLSANMILTFALLSSMYFATRTTQCAVAIRI